MCCQRSKVLETGRTTSADRRLIAGMVTCCLRDGVGTEVFVGAEGVRPLLSPASLRWEGVLVMVVVQRGGLTVRAPLC